jgi:hypothetical protein
LVLQQLPHGVQPSLLCLPHFLHLPHQLLLIERPLQFAGEFLPLSPQFLGAVFHLGQFVQRGFVGGFLFLNLHLEEAVHILQFDDPR